MKMYKDRTITPGQRVFVYFNLHKKVFSVRDVATGLVIAHTPWIQLRDVKFKVSEAGRQRVIASGVKNVHAGVEGSYYPHLLELPWKKATYNPKKYRQFVDRSDSMELLTTDYVLLQDKEVFYYDSKE